jgi:hypothetical protein
MKTRSKKIQKLAFILILSICLGLPAPAGADGYLVRSGWVCRGTTPKFAAVAVQVIYQGMQDGIPSYQLRQVQGQSENGSDAETVLTLHRAQETMAAPALLSYRGDNGSESATLLLRLLDGSEQSLAGNLRIVRANGSVEVIPRLSCNRSRP